MGFIGKAVKLGIAKKVFDEARKPHNQRKIKNMVNEFMNKSGQQRTRRR